MPFRNLLNTLDGKINFMHLWLLAKDAYHAKSWKDKFRIWMMPLGWRPQDVIEQYPVYKIEDVFDFEKYHNFTGKKTYMPCFVWPYRFVRFFQKIKNI